MNIIQTYKLIYGLGAPMIEAVINDH